MTVQIANATKKRLIGLESILEGWQKEKITSAKLCQLTGWSEATIRHDFWLIKKVLSENAKSVQDGQTGQNAVAIADLPKGVSNGYKTQELLSAIRLATGAQSAANGDNLRFPASKNICIAGLGRLGAALLDEGFFEGSGFVIKAGFDSNVNRVEILRSTFPLYPAAEMAAVIRREGITLAVLATAEKDAQAMADRLVAAGVMGIVNMTRAVLQVSEGVKVENTSVVNALRMINIGARY